MFHCLRDPNIIHSTVCTALECLALMSYSAVVKSVKRRELTAFAVMQNCRVHNNRCMFLKAKHGDCFDAYSLGYLWRTEEGGDNKYISLLPAFRIPSLIDNEASIFSDHEYSSHTRWIFLTFPSVWTWPLRYVDKKNEKLQDAFRNSWARLMKVNFSLMSPPLLCAYPETIKPFDW